MISRPGAVLLATLLVASAATGVASAQTDEPDWSDEVYENVAEMLPTYNERVDEVDLGVAGDQLAEKRVNVYIVDGDQTATYSFYMDESNRITDLQRDPHPDAQLRLHTSRRTIDDIADAEDPTQAFRDAVRTGDISISGEKGHPVEQVKWTVINFLAKFLM